jgi:hypothetical protein
MKGLDLLILGSPAHGGFPTAEMDSLLKASPALEGTSVAVFDIRTRTTVFGYAAPRMAKRLKRRGGNLVAPPEGFLVLGIEGPLKDRELERVARWARGMAEKPGQPDGR